MTAAIHSSLRPLMVLLDQAERERDQALAGQNRAEAALLAARRQQQQLADYRQECETRWTEQFRQGVAMTLLQCYHDFVGRLHGAVDQQAQQIERLCQERERAGAVTLAAELRLAAVRKLLERRSQALLRSANAREQKQMDEMAARAGWQRRPEPGVDSETTLQGAL